LSSVEQNKPFSSDQAALFRERGNTSATLEFEKLSEMNNEIKPLKFEHPAENGEEATKNQFDISGSFQILNSKHAKLNQNKSTVSRERLFYALRLVMDTLLILLAFGLAYFVRYVLQIGVEVLEEYQVPFTNYISIELAYTFVLLVTLHFKGFYRRKQVLSFLDELGIILSSTLIAVASMMVLVFISRPLAFSRLMFVFLIPATFLILGIERIVVKLVRRSLWHRGIGVRSLLVVGATDSASRLMDAVVANPDHRYRLAGYVDDETRFSEWILPPRYPDGQPVSCLGTLNNLSTLLYSHKIDEVIIALPATHHIAINDIINICRENEVDFNLIPDIFEMRLDSLNFTEINGVPLIGFKGTNLTGWNYVLKRAMDITLSLITLVALSPFLLLIALLIKLDSKGAVIYKQTRVGKHGNTFTFYKFRSMKVGSDQQVDNLAHLNETGGVTFKIANDPRRTRLGKFLRRTSLDELPQLFNILFGQMSFVGPRPPIDREVEKYEEWHYRRLEVACGLTGLWQISGRSKLSFDDMVKLDIYYAENWSLWLDFKILIRTIPAVLKGEGAY